MNIKRYAIVRGHNLDPAVVTRYLPSNYRVLWTGKCDWHKTSHGEWKQHPLLNDTVVVIEGTDDHGWSLHQYVQPRLGSGLMSCEEIDLSHPVMELIPA